MPRIVTYNIAGNHDTFSVEGIAAVLHDTQADIICLQEVNQVKDQPQFTTQAHLIADALRMTCVFGKAMERKIKGEYGNAILSRYPIHSIRSIELPRGSKFKDNGDRMPGQNEPRVAVVGIVSPVPNGTEDFVVICTHFGIYNSEERSTRALDVIKRVKAFFKTHGKDTHSKLPMLFAGDLNASPNFPVILELEKLFSPLNPNPKGRTTRTREIDYIFGKSSSKVKMDLKACKVLTWEETNNASDHLPVVADFNLVCIK